MKKVDINSYKEDVDASNLQSSPRRSFTKFRAFCKVLSKILFTLAVIGMITGLIVVSSVVIYMVRLSSDKLEYDLRAAKLQLTSFIYINDENGNPKEYQHLYNTENRIWVEFDDIPVAMKNAVIAIEDKRFYEHHGVDWTRTFGAALSLLNNKSNYGGSTITQQLIKNLTEDNEVSLSRKLREIFRARNLEKEYSKDEILEAYLNVVNFGGGCRGVQTAANLYFGKDINDCSIAQCAAIAGITQNPAMYNPLVYPENNKARREIVLREMYEQALITPEEYEAAMQESSQMEFVGKTSGNEQNSSAPVRNWYIEALFNDVSNDLSQKYGIGRAAAEQMVLTQGLKIYCAMDETAQTIAENVIRDKSLMPSDEELELGYVLMGFDGRILATLGCREEKTGDLWYDKANTARRQPGSTIKPIALYAPAIDLGMYNYSSMIPDAPIKNVDVSGFGDYKDWPSNWYGGYRGKVTVKWAIEKSANAPAAQVLVALTPKKSYDFLTQKLGFYSLAPEDSQSLAALATGGTHVGVTVREMTASFQIFGNGGIYNKPYTYFYVLDQNNNILLDNRENTGTRAIKSTTATIMNRLLRNVIVGPEGTGRAANIPGWNVIGKTGTTDDDFDSWFIGATPWAVSGIWTGYDTPRRIHNTGAAINIWKHIMTRYLATKTAKDYSYDPNVFAQTYCTTTGQIADASTCASVDTGYYTADNMPGQYAAAPSTESKVESSVESAASQNTASSAAASSVAPADANSSKTETFVDRIFRNNQGANAVQERNQRTAAQSVPSR